MPIDNSLKNFYRFYILQVLVFSSGLARATAIGYILYQLGVSPKNLGILTAISTLGSLIGFYSISYFKKYYKDLSLVYLISQKLTFLTYLCFALYTLWCIYQHNWGNFWVWTILNILAYFVVSVEQACRPLFVKKTFAHLNYSKIMRQDILTMGIAKIIGFSTGVFIVSAYWALLIFVWGLLITYILYRYIKSKISIIVEDNTAAVIKTTSQVKRVELSYKTTIFIHIATILLLFPINTQVVTYSKIWGIPFYLFYICASFGNVFFNLFLNKKVGLEINRYFIFYISCLVIGFSLFLSTSSWVLFGSFLVGGAYSSFNALSSARLYESGVGSQYISRFYLIGTIVTIIGSYILGLLLEYLNKNYVFILLAVSSLLFYSIIYFYDKKSRSAIDILPLKA